MPVDNPVDNPVDKLVDKLRDLSSMVAELEELARELQLVLLSSNNSNSYSNSNSYNCKEKKTVSFLTERNSCRTPKKRGTTPDPSIKIFLSFYKSRYQEIFGKPLSVSWARDSKLIKTALQGFTLEELKAMAEDFFGLDDNFLRSAGRGVNIFFSKLNALATLKPEGTGWEFLDATEDV